MENSSLSPANADGLCIFFSTCRYTFISRMIHQFKEIISLYNNPHELYQRKHFKIVYINILISLDKLVN